MGEGDIQRRLQGAKDMLETAELGLADLDSDEPRRRMAGFRNLVTFGRAVTNALQRLKTPVGLEFDDWYAIKQQEMRDDPLLRRFYALRNEILKKGEHPVSVSTHLRSFGPADMAKLQRSAPPGAKAFFMGDRLGGDGWRVEMPDGSSESYYVNLDGTIDVKTTIRMVDPPRTHLGQPVTDTTIQALSARYTEYLRKLVEEADGRFGSA